MFRNVMFERTQDNRQCPNQVLSLMQTNEVHLPQAEFCTRLKEWQSSNWELLTCLDLFKLFVATELHLEWGTDINLTTLFSHIPKYISFILSCESASISLSSSLLKGISIYLSFFSNKMFSFLSSFMGDFATIIRNISHKEEKLRTSDCERSDDWWCSS